LEVASQELEHLLRPAFAEELRAAVAAAFDDVHDGFHAFRLELVREPLALLDTDQWILGAVNEVDRR
jgi:hypothetical protein